MSSPRGRIYDRICPEACWFIREPLDSAGGSIYVPVACGSFHSPSKPGKMSPYHTFVRGRCYDSAPYLLPAGDRGTPVALRHAALHVAKPRRSVTAATGAAGAPAVEAHAVQWAQIFCGSHPTPSLRSMRI